MDSLYRAILRNLFKRFWCLKCGDRFPLIWDFITYFVWLFYFHLLSFSYAFIAIFLYILFYISNQRNLNCCIFDVFYSFILLLFYIHGDGSYTVIPLIICYKRIQVPRYRKNRRLPLWTSVMSTGKSYCVLCTDDFHYIQYMFTIEM